MATRFVFERDGACDAAITRHQTDSSGSRSVVYVQCPFDGYITLPYAELTEAERSAIAVASAGVTRVTSESLKGTQFRVCPVHTDVSDRKDVIRLPWRSLERDDEQKATTTLRVQSKDTYRSTPINEQTVEESKMQIALARFLPTVSSPSLRKIIEAGAKYAATASSASPVVKVAGSSLSSAPVNTSERRAADYLATRRLIGFQNMGNTCFMNATLQCLCSIKIFRSQFSDNSLGLKDGTVYQNLLKLLAATSPNDATEESEIYRYLDGIKSLGTQTGRALFEGYNQHDAHEFLTHLLETIPTQNNIMKVYQKTVSPCTNCQDITVKVEQVENIKLYLGGEPRPKLTELLTSLRVCH
jgi:hypothetical protein